MMANPQAAPIGDLQRKLDLLASEIAGFAIELDETALAYFRGRKLHLLTALLDVAQAASKALEPAMLEEMHRAEARRRIAGEA